MNVSIYEQPPLLPVAAVVIYENKNRDTAAILYKIKPNGRLSCGKNLNMAMMEDLFRSSNAASVLDFVPRNILAMNNSTIIWYEKSRLSEIYFEVPEADRRELNQLSGRKIIWPPLLFMIRGQDLYCYALRTKCRPTPETRLFLAPLTHMDEATGKVCMPSSLRLDANMTSIQKMRLIAERFYDGVFGHVTGSMKQITCPGGHDGFWIEYLNKEKQDRFPVELLKSTNKKIKDILR